MRWSSSPNCSAFRSPAAASSGSGQSRSRPAIRSISGPVLANMRFPSDIDLRLNLGNQYGERRTGGATLVSIRRDPTSLARVSPVDLALVSDLKLAAADLVAAVKSLATKERLAQIAADRARRVHDYTKGMADLRQPMLKEYATGSDNAPIKLERLASELETALEKDTIYVNDVDSGKKMDPFLSFGGARQDLRRQRTKHPGLGHVGGVRRQARATGPAGGRRARRRRVPVRRTAAALEPGSLQRADHQHRSQQHELQQRAQPHLVFHRRRAGQIRPRHDLLQRQPRRRYRQDSASLRRRGRERQGRVRCQGCARRAHCAPIPTGGHTCSTFTCNAMAWAPHRNGIRRSRSRICGPGRCDMAIAHRSRRPRSLYAGALHSLLRLSHRKDARSAPTRCRPVRAATSSRSRARNVTGSTLSLGCARASRPGVTRSMT